MSDSGNKTRNRKLQFHFISCFLFLLSSKSQNVDSHTMNVPLFGLKTCFFIVRIEIQRQKYTVTQLKDYS